MKSERDTDRVIAECVLGWKYYEQRPTENIEYPCVFLGKNKRHYNLRCPRSDPQLFRPMWDDGMCRFIERQMNSEESIMYVISLMHVVGADEEHDPETGLIGFKGMYTIATATSMDRVKAMVDMLETT